MNKANDDYTIVLASQSLKKSSDKNSNDKRLPLLQLLSAKADCSSMGEFNKNHTLYVSGTPNQKMIDALKIETIINCTNRENNMNVKYENIVFSVANWKYHSQFTEAQKLEKLDSIVEKVSNSKFF